MGKSSNRSAAYAFTGKYEDDNDGNTIHAIGIGGVINAYGGNDYIVVGSVGATVNTTWGHDTVVGAAGYLDINDTSGTLTVKGGSGYTSINKTSDGTIEFIGAAGGLKINHTGDKGRIDYSGASGYNSITRKGLEGNFLFKGAGAYNELWHETNQGNFYFAGAGGGNKIDRTWFNRYQGSNGDLTFEGIGAANIISSRVESGDIFFAGAGAANNLVRRGKTGNVNLTGAGASNRIERTRQADDVYSETRGDIKFEGAGGYNSLYSDVAHGDIRFVGVGGYNQITRKGTDNDFDNEGMEYAKAEDIVLKNATMSGEWIGYNVQVTGLKSARESNTYLFAFADGMYTKVNKVQLRNDPETGKLIYHSTSWYKEGNRLKDLEKQDISVQGGFKDVKIDGAYTLSNLEVEHQQSVTIHSVEKKLAEDQWINHGDGVLVGVADVTLSNAKMGGYAIDSKGGTADVQVVKSNHKSNTYIYAKRIDKYTKIVVIELRNDPKTGMLQYNAQAWLSLEDRMAKLANEDISSANGYQAVPAGIYTLSDLHYSAKAVRTASERVSGMHEYSDLALFKAPTSSGKSSGDVHYTGAGGGNVIHSNVTRGNVYFNGAGIANVIEHTSEFGNTEFNGGGAANVIVKKGKEGNLAFNGVGIANVILHQGLRGDMDVNAGGAANILVRVGDGRYLAHLLAVGNISIHKGNGNSRISMGGGFNTHTQIGHGDAFWSGVGGFNVLTQMGKGHVSSILLGGANVLTKVGEGDLESAMLGGANIITHISNNHETSNTKAIALGGANVLTKKGRGDVLSVMGGGANVLTHVGDGRTTGVMLGGANILTKVGNGDTTGIMLGLGNILTHVGNGQTLGVMAAAGNIFTKVGEGTTIAAMVGAGNIFTHVGQGNAWALMGGIGNIFTKVGDGDALALMLAAGNVFTHVGDGMSVALMVAKGNIATKVGHGEVLSAMIGEGNILTQIGNGDTFAAMLGKANILTKVGNGLTAALMVSEANIYTHVGDGTSIGLFVGSVNVMTKVGNGTTLVAMFGKANIMTHVGDGLTGVLALSKANIVTKVGDDFMGVVAASEANVVTHVGDGPTAAVLLGKGNVLTKVGDGTTVGLLISKIGNVMTHLGDGTTIGFAKGEANIMTKLGDGLGINAAWGKANIITHMGGGDRYNFAKGEANVITKVGEGQEITVVQGQANIVTHVGNGDDYTGAWGKANVITKVGDGRNVVLAKGDANIVTQIGNGDSFNALWSQGNVVTKVGDGMQVTVAKGKSNITTTVGNGLSVTTVHGELNVNTKVGDGVSVNVTWGKLNVNTRVGDGLNVSVMKGQANANIRVGDGLNINASYARNNVAIQVGNGDFYSLAVAESNTESNKLGALFDNVKQTLLGVGGSQGISYLVNGDEANTSGTHKGRGAINLPEVSALNGFQLTEMEQVKSDLQNSLKGSVTGVDTPDTDSIQNTLGNEKRLSSNQSRNLIVNGDFEQDADGWQSTNGIEAYYAAQSYGLSNEGHGERVSELDAYTHDDKDSNTSIYQDISDLTVGESITLSFDFAKRADISADNGMEVLWNGKTVFSISAGNAEWQNKTLSLTAQAGSNRLEFKGTGTNDGLGYILDNVVAKSELLDSAIAGHLQQDAAAQNALQDKEKAEADRQRLEQERDTQLAAVSGSRAQLEATDLEALNGNGQDQRDAINNEAEAVTEELAEKVKGLATLDSYSKHHGKSGEQWRAQFAGGLLGQVQTQLNRADDTAQQQLDRSQHAASERFGDLRDAVTKSETGVSKGEQHQQQSQKEIEQTRTNAEFRKQQALSQKKQAEHAESDAKAAVQKAGQRGQHEVSEAVSQTARVQSDAKAAKQSDNYKPNRAGAAGSGLSGTAYESHTAENQPERVKTDNPIGFVPKDETNTGFSQELQYLDEDLNELTEAKAALNRLQINAAKRGKNTGATLISAYTETSVSQPVSKTADVPTEWVRNAPKISGLDLSGLQALGETHVQQGSTDAPEASATAIRAQKVADVYRWLDSDNNIATDTYIPVPGFDREDADIPDNIRQKLVTFVEGYLEGTDNSVPKEQVAPLAKLFVDATIDCNWDKRVEFVSKLEQYGYSFEPVHGDKSIVSFWSGKNFKQYRDVLDAVQTDGKKVVYDIDVKGNSFAIELNKTLMRWGNVYLDSDNAEHNELQTAINASARSNTGFWSSLYATGSRDDVYVIAEGGLRLGNYFWNVELPVLRQLQREGLVGEIRLLDKPAREYQGAAPESIGRRLTEAGVSVKARFDSLSIEEQERLLTLNPTGYKPDTLIDLDIKLSAIDNMLNQALPFYGLRTERNLLVREADDEGFEVRRWPGHDGDDFKTIIVEDAEDPAQIKAIERFILANYDDYGKLPDALYLVADQIVSHEQGRTRIVAKKVDGSWNYKPKTDLMSVSEFKDAASVKGKILGDSYRNVLEALGSYEKALQNGADYDLDAVEKLISLHQQVEGYLLGHPDSKRLPAMTNLLSQINVRMEESRVLAEPTLTSTGKGSFSELYNKLGNANLKDSKHLYIDEQGDFVTRGKSNIQIVMKAEETEKAVRQIKVAVTREYGQEVAETVFSNLKPHDLSKDGNGIDVSGLRKVHQAIEQQLSPVSATLFVWKPSDHSQLGHAALQIGQGRIQVSAEDAEGFNEKNYVSWWPKGGKSTSPRHIFDVSTEQNPDVRLRWRDLSQPASPNEALEFDVGSEEGDNFGLKDGTYKLEKFIEKLQAAKGVDAKFENISEGFAMAMLANPNLLKSAGIPEHISRPFIEQWENGNIDMQDVGRDFAEALRTAAKQKVTPELTEKRITNIIRQFAERELSDIQDFKASEADQGRVFRINLAGLDAAAMQAEWNKISQNPDARYQILNGNCSSIVAKVLKAGGSDKVIGHTWRPNFGIWTPTELFNYAQKLQEAQIERIANKPKRIVGEDPGLFNVKRQPDESTELKGIKSDLKRYSEALKPLQTGSPRKVKDIRATQGFLTGYQQGHAEQTVDGFRSDMNIKQLVDLLVKGNWTAEQKGSLAWEIESRALKVTFQPQAEKHNRLFNDVVSAGVADTKANKHLAPQLLLLDLSNDGFGGRCDPLSKLVLVAKQRESEGQDGVARKLLEKMYSAAAVLSNPELYSDTERANANKLLGSLAALHARNPMHDTSMKVWQEKLEGKLALTVNGVIGKVTTANADGKPVLLELDVPGHAMAAWAKGSGENRVYGFYDPNAGIVEFSSAEKFGDYFTRFFGKSGLNMEKSYELPKNDAGEIIFNRVVVMDGSVLATYSPTWADKTTMQGILDLNIFDETPFKAHSGVETTHEVKAPLKDNLPEGVDRVVNNENVEYWEPAFVKPQAEGGDSRFNGQVIIQTENDPVAAKAAARLAGKHPDSSVIVQLDANGQYRVVYGDPATLSGKLRWQIVGHGRDESVQNHTRMSGYSADELALKLKQFRTDFKQAGSPDHISLVGCSLISDDKRDGFARHFISALDKQGIRTTVSARSSEVAVDSIGRKFTRNAEEQWVHKLIDNKIVLGWNDKGELETPAERIRRGISESDINLSRVGHMGTDVKAKGAIVENTETFHAPEQHKKVNDDSSATSPAKSSNNKLSYSGNIQVQAGDGEFTAINWGTTNVGIKVGTGGFKSLAFGDNNVMVHMGNGDSKHSVNIAGYQALEGAQFFMGNRNVSFNQGRSNDLIVMMDKSIPTPPLINPFDGASRISGVLQGIAGSFDSPDWLSAQDQQWTLESAKKYVSDLSGLDLTSNVAYNTLTDLDAENERSSRGLKSDIETTLNKKYNQWLGRKGNTREMGNVSRADKFRQANEKLAFNFAVGGQGADIQVTTGNWNFMFGDNIQSILDTNLGSLFGLMTQEYTSTGMAKTTFTFSPTDLPRQLKNKLLGNLAGVSADTTLADIFGVDYTADGHIVSRSNQSVDGVAILREMLEVIGEFSGDQLQAFTDPAKLLDSLEAGLNMGADGVKSFAESHGLKAKAPDENKEGHVSISEKGKPVQEAEELPSDRAFGFNLPSLFTTLFKQDKQVEMASLVADLKENLTADLLNMQDKTFDFLRNSGHLQGDGDMHVSLGNYNFNWGGDGKDLGAYLGDNNNFWGGRGDDVYYSVGTSNIFTGGEGNDMGVLMGRENMMFGGAGNDVAVLAGRINYAYMGDGDDQVFVFGEGGVIDGGKGRDYIVASGNFNNIHAGEGQDYVVAIGNNNQVDLGAGDDFATVFGNYNNIDGNAGNNAIKLMGYHAAINGGTGDDHLIADVVSKFSQLNGGDGDDLLVLGGYQNHFKGGTGVNSFVVSGEVIDNVVEDINRGDKIIFNNLNWQKLWFQRSGYDLVLLTGRDVTDTSVQGKFEAMGSVTFNDYFNGNRADIVTQMGDKDAQGEREYTALSANSVDSLVQAMSGFAPNMGDTGFIDTLDSQTKSTIVTAWADTTSGKSKLA
ncbi:MARTX multifunctional-autoprocessing repeats-in-toxin holotoxin RtxA [Xenorhabdus sp. XENO-1]|uniref:MARTX multifunctional-autoprocessing repeats-in-toxin holotoxin RtxA n=1 Tax=Xenorhabdus bovienii TaxID=40576 RepID=UPI0020CA4889|nr:MARTX multifunctional-autoprocessing repeats-in-toxin holotoxin RtxA [Xenorhabdus bovienii]MCP9268020.1 MARTX multifunctional-autoprocessing repeats-in-toxin holotoxin RtxA [Xenorhabdus bovienii subsp. africana]